MKPTKRTAPRTPDTFYDDLEILRDKKGIFGNSYERIVESWAHHTYRINDYIRLLKSTEEHVWVRRCALEALSKMAERLSNIKSKDVKYERKMIFRTFFYETDEEWAQAWHTDISSIIQDVKRKTMPYFIDELFEAAQYPDYTWDALGCLANMELIKGSEQKLKANEEFLKEKMQDKHLGIVKCAIRILEKVRKKYSLSDETEIMLNIAALVHFGEKTEISPNLIPTYGMERVIQEAENYLKTAAVQRKYCEETNGIYMGDFEVGPETQLRLTIAKGLIKGFEKLVEQNGLPENLDQPELIDFVLAGTLGKRMDPEIKLIFALRLMLAFERFIEKNGIPKNISNRRIKESLDELIEIAKQVKQGKEKESTLSFYAKMMKILNQRTSFKSTLPPRIPRPKRRPGDRSKRIFRVKRVLRIN